VSSWRLAVYREPIATEEAAREQPRHKDGRIPEMLTHLWSNSSTAVRRSSRRPC